MRFVLFMATALLVALAATMPVAAASPITMVRDINPAGASSPSDLVAVGNRLYFVADDGTHGRELWRTDGTTASTSLVADVRQGRSSSNPDLLAGAGNTLFFSANDGVHGRELWRTDGSIQGTQLVKNITSGAGGTEFGQAAVMLGSRLFFVANGHSWVTNGNAAETRNIGPMATTFVPFANRMFFLSGPYPYEQRIWKSDGTAAGTALASWSPLEVNELAATDSTLFMLSGVQTPAQNTPPTLWKTDGTKAGTVRLTVPKELDQAYGLVTTASQAFFFDENYDPDETAQLWRSNGSVAGTKPLAIVPIPIPTPRAVSDNLMFFGNSGGANWQLWKSNGTAKGTQQVDSLTGLEPSETTVAGSSLCFYTYDYDLNQWTLWESNSSIAGANQAASGSPASQHPFHLTAAGTTLYFSLDDGVSGAELWSHTP